MNIITKKVLAGGVAGNGYLTVGLKNKTHTIHRLVANAFIANSLNKRCVNHKDGDKLNNNINNLEWCSYSENNQHAYHCGLKKHNRLVLNTSTGIYYDSASDAADAHNIGKPTLNRYLNGVRKNKTNLIYA